VEAVVVDGHQIAFIQAGQGLRAALYTSTRILDAEARLVAAAGRRGGASVEQAAVDLALLEMAANGTALDAGQAALVRQMCTSGARLQLAIAPAGARKTTAMRALTLAWTEDGGQVVGLAPSAAAAAVLGEQTGTGSDTGRQAHLVPTAQRTAGLGGRGRPVDVVDHR
jgi:ATP-dependent exoDNAse (exonuclease V) alpha subunit